MAVFSAFVVNVGDSVRTFHAGVAGEAWGLSGMSLGLAAALLTAGALADDLGHRRVLRCSAGLLAAASAVGALAPSIEILVAARVLQGVAGGGILAAGLGSIGSAFPSGQARTHATAVWGAAVGAGVTIGPLAGAGLAAPVGWRSGFWVEAAAATALAAAAATLTESRATSQGRIDLPGIATLGTGMTLLTAALVGTRHGWSASTTLALFSAATLALGAFAAVELRSRHPMLDPHLLAQPKFLASISGALFTGLAVVGLMSYAPALMQQSLHISEIGSAAVLAAWSATSMLVALAAGSLPTRLPAQTRLLIGLALAAVGELALTGLGSGASWTRLVPGLFVTGVGTGIVNASFGQNRRRVGAPRPRWNGQRREQHRPLPGRGSRCRTGRLDRFGRWRATSLSTAGTSPRSCPPAYARSGWRSSRAAARGHAVARRAAAPAETNTGPNSPGRGRLQHRLKL